MAAELEVLTETVRTEIREVRIEHGLGTDTIDEWVKQGLISVKEVQVVRKSADYQTRIIAESAGILVSQGYADSGTAADVVQRVSKARMTEDAACNGVMMHVETWQSVGLDQDQIYEQKWRLVSMLVNLAVHGRITHKDAVSYAKTLLPNDDVTEMYSDLAGRYRAIMSK